jgi:hypothetical protein
MPVQWCFEKDFRCGGFLHKSQHLADTNQVFTVVVVYDDVAVVLAEEINILAPDEPNILGRCVKRESEVDGGL